MSSTTAQAASPTAPSAPQSVTLSPHFQSGYLTWTAPASDGGSPVTSYLIDLDDPNGTQQQVSLAPTATDYTFNSLTTGDSYFIFMYAINAYGVSGPGQSAEVTLQPRTSNSGSVVGIASTPDGLGYYIATSGGYVYTFGDAQWYGDVSGVTLNAPVVGIALDKATGGYWLAGADGGLFEFNAPFEGSLAGTKLNCPIVSIAADTTDGGYYMFGCDGGVYNFGDAPFKGSIYGFNNGSAQTWFGSPIVGGAVDPQGGGYWIVAQNNVVCSFGTVDTEPAGQPWGNYGDWCRYAYSGSSGNPKDIVGMRPMTDGNGYWLAGADGGVFNLGDAPFYGSLGGTKLNAPVVGMTTPPTSASNAGKGYWMVGSDGGLFEFGQAGFYGSAVSPPSAPPPPAFAWGVDTTSNVQTSSSTSFPQIAGADGTPAFVGRYILIQSASPMTASEATYIHQQNSKILLIDSYDQGDLTGLSKGEADAAQAIAAAEALGVPTGNNTVIMRDIEAYGYPDYTYTDSSYIEGWIEGFQSAGNPYQPGFYENPVSTAGPGPFPASYCSAINQNPAFAEESTLWSSEPDIGDVGSVPNGNNPPTFQADTPGCGQNNTDFVQYAINGNSVRPNVDFDEGQDGGIGELY